MNFPNDSYFLLVISFLFVSQKQFHKGRLTGCYCESAVMLPGIHNIVCIAKCWEGEISQWRDYALLKLMKQLLQSAELWQMKTRYTQSKFIQVVCYWNRCQFASFFPCISNLLISAWAEVKSVLLYYIYTYGKKTPSFGSSRIKKGVLPKKRKCWRRWISDLQSGFYLIRNYSFGNTLIM